MSRTKTNTNNGITTQTFQVFSDARSVPCFLTDGENNTKLYIDRDSFKDKEFFTESVTLRSDEDLNSMFGFNYSIGQLQHGETFKGYHVKMNYVPFGADMFAIGNIEKDNGNFVLRSDPKSFSIFSFKSKDHALAALNKEKWKKAGWFIALVAVGLIMAIGGLSAL